LPSRAKVKQPPKRKPRNIANILFVIFGLIMAVAMVVTAIAGY
jgi:hypothetical protein